MVDKKKITTKKEPRPSIWEVLSKIDCSEHIEKKGGFNYLSWTWAWGILMEHYPDATFDNALNDNSYPCFYDPNGYGMVRVTLCIEDQCHSEDYPVLDYRNKAVENPDSFAVNTALKRCLVKCMAYFGLGHYIYAGEDLPPQEEVPFDKDEALELIKLTQLAKNEIDNDKGAWIKSVLKHFKVDVIEKLSEENLQAIVNKITNSKEKTNG